MQSDAPHPPSAESCPSAMPLYIEHGTCFVTFAFDVGQSINLDQAATYMQTAPQRETIRYKRRSPKYFEFRPAPLRITMPTAPLRIGNRHTEASVDYVLFDFGALSVTHRIPLHGPLEAIVGLGDALYDGEPLHTASREGATRLVRTIRNAIQRADVLELVEDYSIYQVDQWSPAAAPRQVLAGHGETIARVLRAEPGSLSKPTVRETLQCRVGFSRRDMIIIDWNAAMLFGPEMEDVLTVLEYANVELLEMRYLDDRLDDALDRAYEAFSRRSRWGGIWSGSSAADLRRVAQLQLEGALLFEGVNNAVKLIGEQFLARVYRLAVRRLHLDEYDASILRKLSTIESLYQKMADQQAARRMELLEWIIILLIFISIVLPFLPGAGK